MQSCGCAKPRAATAMAAEREGADAKDMPSFQAQLVDRLEEVLQGQRRLEVELAGLGMGQQGIKEVLSEVSQELKGRGVGMRPAAGSASEISTKPSIGAGSSSSQESRGTAGAPTALPGSQAATSRATKIPQPSQDEAPAFTGAPQKKQRPTPGMLPLVPPESPERSSKPAADPSPQSAAVEDKTRSPMVRRVLRPAATKPTLDANSKLALFPMLHKGDRVQVIKESRMKGKTAVVLDPCWNDLVKVWMEEKDSKGEVKSYKRQDLELLQGDDEVVKGPSALALPAAWPTNIKLRGSLEKALADITDIKEIVSRDPSTFGKYLFKSAATLAVHKENDHLSRDPSNGSPMGKSEHSGSVRKRRFFLVMQPLSKRRTLLDLCCLTALVYDMVSVPFMLAWDLQIEGELLIFALASASFWVADMLASFLTGFWRHGNVETRLVPIAQNYFRSWFLPDLLVVMADWVSILIAALPRDTMDKISPSDHLRNTGRLIRILDVIRLAKLSHLLDRFAALDLLGGSGGSIYVQIPQLLVLILWVNHVIGCCWYAIGVWAPSDTGMSWIDAMGHPGENPVSYRESSRGYQYSTAIHWALTQMTPGSMQVFPLNTWERCFNNVTLVLGLMFFGSIISMLTAKMTQYRMAKQERQNSLALLRRFLLQSNVTKELATKVQKQVLDRLNAKRQVTKKDVPAIKLLSLKLQVELQYELCKPHLMRLTIFRLCDKIDGNAMRQLCQEAADFTVYSPHDTVFLPGTEAEETRCILRGEVFYLQDEWSSKATKPTRALLQPGEWLCEVALWTHWSHVGTAEAATACEMLNIKPTKIVTALSKHYLIWDVVQEYGKLYHKFLITDVPPKVGDWPSDIHKPFEDDEVFACMARDIRTFIGLVAIEILRKLPWYRLAINNVIGKLEEEVRSGQCTLTISESGEVVRIVSVTALRLVRPDGLILCEIGKRFADGSFKAKCALPGTKQEEAETPSKALERLLAKLPSLQRAIQVGSSNVSMARTESGTYMIASKYIRTTFEGTLQEELISLSLRDARVSGRNIMSAMASSERRSVFPRTNTTKPMSAMPTAQTSAMGSVDSEHFGDREILAFNNGEKYDIYAWLTVEEAESMIGTSGSSDKGHLGDILSKAAKRWARDRFSTVERGSGGTSS